MNYQKIQIVIDLLCLDELKVEFAKVKTLFMFA